MDLSVIIPVLNEEGNIPTLYQRVTTVLKALDASYELVFVNDGSTDQTLKKIQELSSKDPAVQYVDFSRNFGHQIAVSAGLDHSRGEAVVIIDADLQDPPELILQLYRKMKEGFEVVYARRAKRHGETWFKLLTAKMFYRVINSWSNVNIPLDTGDFRIMHRKVVDILCQMPEKHKFLRGQIAWIGFRQTWVEYDRDIRLSGETKYPLKKMLRFALDGITGFSTVPLKLATMSGFIASGLAFLMILWVTFVKLFGYRFGLVVQPGWASTLIAILFLGGIQLIGIGILGEYIGRINDNIKDRPLYVVREVSKELKETNPKTN